MAQTDPERAFDRSLRSRLAAEKLVDLIEDWWDSDGVPAEERERRLAALERIADRVVARCSIQ